MKRIRVSLLMLISLLSIAQLSYAQSLADGIKLYNYEKFGSAKKVFEGLAASDLTANYYLGLCELALQNTAGAKTIFLKNATTDAQHQAGLARVMFAENDAVQAMAMLHSIVGKTKKKEYLNFVYAANAITYSKNSNYDQAIAWYDMALERQKSDEIYMSKGDAYLAKSDGGGQAMRQYKDYALEIAKPENKSLLYYKMGRLWYSAEIYDSSLVYYQMAKDADANNPLPYRDLGNAYAYIGKYEKAKENYESYIKLGDNTLDDQLNYANILFQTNNYNDAVSKVNDLLSKGVEKPYMYRVLGYSYNELNDLPKALANLDILFKKEQASKIIPRDYYTYGKILLKDSSKAAGAPAYFTKAMALDSTKNKAKNIREVAMLYMKSKDYKNAAPYFKTICDQLNAGAETNDYYYAGVTEFVNTNFSSAETYLKKYADRLPNEPTAYSWLGKAQAQIDKEAKLGTAELAYTKLIELATDPVKYKDDLVKAYNYLMFLSNGRKDTAKAKEWATKLQGIDPANTNAKAILGK